MVELSYSKRKNSSMVFSYRCLGKIWFFEIMGSHGFVVVDVDISQSSNWAPHSSPNVNTVYIFICNPSHFTVLVANYRVHLPYVWGEEC